MILRVDILRVDSKSDKVVARIELKDRAIHYSGKHAKFYEEIHNKNGIRDFTQMTRKGKMCYPKDGALFLKNLKHEYCGARIKATDIMEIKE